ncbi:hypothetical protein DRJ54_02320 [Candidatus Acetothermia bacterium]|nr:MAG: hypothetical protein DRJ54_02320 [Candidatus Acetothermia bacterium]
MYTGDLRLHGELREATLEFVEEARRPRPRLLLIEGTRAGPLGRGNPTEDDVRERAHEIIAGSWGKLVIGGYPVGELEAELSRWEVQKRVVPRRDLVGNRCSEAKAMK